MPGINPPNDNLLPHYIAQINNRLRAVETQQQLIISNLKGQPVLAFGMQPGSNPAEWGLGLLRQTFRGRAAFFGESSTGAVAVKFYDTTGRVLVEVNDVGQTVYNGTGTEEVRLGAIGTGVYGLAVRNPAGAMQIVAGRAITTKVGPLTYSANSYGALSGGPSVSVTVPPSGKLDIAIGAVITPNSYSTGETAILATSVNGGSDRTPYLEVSAGVNDALPQTAYAEAQITGLTPGSTATISTQAWVSTPGVTASFKQVTITATPV